MLFLQLICLIALSSQTTTKSPGCTFSEYFVPYCSHGPWQAWDCSSCPTEFMASRHRALCCESSLSKTECYKNCSIAEAEGFKRELCMVCDVPLRTCNFPPTNEVLKYCEFSTWLEWDCTKCTNNRPGNVDTTIRQRGICGAKAWSFEAFTKNCGKEDEVATATDMCVNVCPLLQSTPRSSQGLLMLHSTSETGNNLHHTPPLTLHKSTTSDSQSLSNIKDQGTKDVSYSAIPNSLTTSDPSAHGLNGNAGDGSRCNMPHVCFVGPWTIDDNPKDLCK